MSTFCYDKDNYFHVTPIWSWSTSYDICRIFYVPNHCIKVKWTMKLINAIVQDDIEENKDGFERVRVKNLNQNTSGKF